MIGTDSFWLPARQFYYELTLLAIERLPSMEVKEINE